MLCIIPHVGKFSNIILTGYKSTLLTIEGDNNYAIWNSGDGSQSTEMQFDINKELKNISIVLGWDHPNGTEALVIIKNTGYNLLRLSGNPKFLKSAFDEYGELNDEYYLQASTFDFDNDGNMEVIISIGNINIPNKYCKK